MSGALMADLFPPTSPILSPLRLLVTRRRAANPCPPKNSRVARRFQNRELTARPTVRGLNVAAVGPAGARR